VLIRLKYQRALVVTALEFFSGPKNTYLYPYQKSWLSASLVTLKWDSQDLILNVQKVLLLLNFNIRSRYRVFNGILEVCLIVFFWLLQ